MLNQNHVVCLGVYDSVDRPELAGYGLQQGVVCYVGCVRRMTIQTPLIPAPTLCAASRRHHPKTIAASERASGHHQVAEKSREISGAAACVLAAGGGV